MPSSTYEYVAYIRATPDQLWSALTNTELTKHYWFGMRLESRWTAGSSWRMLFPDGKVCDAGEIVDAVPKRRLAIRWQNQCKPELTAEGPSLCTMKLEPNGEAIKLTLIHSMERERSQFIATASSFWPMVISNLKSFLETGSAVLESYQKSERHF